MAHGVVGNTTPKRACICGLYIRTQQTCDFTQLSSHEDLSQLRLVSLVFLA